MVKIYGRSWTYIASEMPGRTENSIKNRFYSSFRSLSRKSFIFFSFVLRIKDKNKNKKLPEINDLFMSNHQTKNCIEDKLTEYINDYKTNSESLEGINLTHKI